MQHRLGRFSHGLTPMISSGGTAEIHLCLLVPVVSLVPLWIQCKKCSHEVFFLPHGLFSYPTTFFIFKLNYDGCTDILN